MIHQLIFANPKPEMSVKEFQDYWINVHAVQYASKIQQIKKYYVNRILPLANGQDPKFHGVAEIWLENEKEQLESLMSDEFVKGARADEPNWAAFWETIQLDTYSYDKLLCDTEPEYKLMILLKRREGMELKTFREEIMDKYSRMLIDIDDIKQLTVSIVKDSFYSVSEASFDIVLHIWANSIGAAKALLSNEGFCGVYSQIKELVNEKYIYQFLCQKNRIF